MMKFLVSSFTFVLVSGVLAAQGLVIWKDSKTHKFGFSDQEGKIVVTPKFDALKSVRNGMWVSKVGKKYGLLSTKADEGGNFAESVLECQDTVLAIGAREYDMQPPMLSK